MAARTLSIMAVVVCGLASMVAAGPVEAEPLTVAAPHSLKPVFEEILPMFEGEYGVPLQVTYGPSKMLRRQIEKGASIDVFLADGVDDVEELQQKGLTLNGGPRIYAQTSLVLVMSIASHAIPVAFPDVLPNKATRIALGDPKATALGDITAKALTKLDPSYKTRSNFLYAQHSDGIVDLVHLRKADVGIVYRVDAINSGQLRIIDEALVPVQFGQAVVWTCRKDSLAIAEDFFDFMMSPRVQKLLLKYGFDHVPSND